MEVGVYKKHLIDYLMAVILGFIGTVASHAIINIPKPFVSHNVRETKAERRPEPRTLWPLTNWGGIGPHPKPDLYDFEEVY
ncbi:hypothetical protein ACHAPJ_008616 [Fusarium lateritium]